MGETAIKFMSQGKLSQRFPFQVVGKVNFKKPETIAKAIKKLTDSGIKRVLMMMHSRHVEAILTEVKIQKAISCYIKLKIRSLLPLSSSEKTFVQFCRFYRSL